MKDLNHCDLCHRNREAGDLLIRGRCMLCGPERFEERRELLRQQARELLKQGRIWGHVS